MKQTLAIPFTDRSAAWILALAAHVLCVAWLLHVPPVMPAPVVSFSLVVAEAASSAQSVSSEVQGAVAQPQIQEILPEPVKAAVAPRKAVSVKQMAALAPAAAKPRTIADAPAQYDAAYLHNPPPVYPPMARRMNQQGQVLLRVRVDAQGQAQQVELVRGSGHAILDGAAREAVAKWRFVPAQQQGQAAESWVQVPVAFELEES